MSSANGKRGTGASVGSIATGGSTSRGDWYLRDEVGDGFGTAKGTVGKLS